MNNGVNNQLGSVVPCLFRYFADGISVRATLVFCLLLLCGQCTGAATACERRPIGEAPPAYLNDLLARLRTLGVVDISKAREIAAGNHYVVVGADFTVFLVEQSGLLQEIGLVISTPISPVELEKLMTAVGYTTAHFSDATESSAKMAGYAGYTSHAAGGEWVTRYGSWTVAYTKLKDGLVVKMAQLDCQ